MLLLSICNNPQRMEYIDKKLDQKPRLLIHTQNDKGSKRMLNFELTKYKIDCLSCDTHEDDVSV